MAYHGKKTSVFRPSRPLLAGLAALAAVGLLLWGAAAWLGQYMFYSIDGGELILPGRSAAAAEEPPLTDVVVIEEYAG